MSMEQGGKVMTSFEFFKRNNLKWLYILWLPRIVIIDERDDYLSRYPEAWGYYDGNTNQIIIVKTFDCTAVRIHEFGHWLNARIYLFIDTLWEIPWWGLGIRNMFNRKVGR